MTPHDPAAFGSPTPATQLNWLELARFAAQGEGHADLGRGVLRLAALSAAAHREHVGNRDVGTIAHATQWNPASLAQGAPR